MQIFLNGEERDVASDCVIEHLLKELDLQDQRLAVEVNQDIIPRSTFASFTLSVDDRVEIVRAVGGG